MSTLRLVILITWGAFWLLWLVSAFGVKRGSRGFRARMSGVTAAAAVVLLRTFSPHTLAVRAIPLQVIGTIMFGSGLALAIWARVHLGRNWGMPMSEKDEPELITSGPYAVIRHPIYSGILLGILGTACATNLYWLILFAVCAPFFIYSATIEERNMGSAFPAVYPSYRAKTKLLIPFVL